MTVRNVFNLNFKVYAFKFVWNEIPGTSLHILEFP